MSERTAIIIGAGPAGLTAAYELLDKSDIKPLIFEMTGDIGGIAKTVNYKGNRIDIGGHRFFSKSDRVMRFWLKVFPLQGAPAKDDAVLGRELPREDEMLQGYPRSQAGESDEVVGRDPERTDKVMLVRKRISRIFFLRKFFDYPISLTLQTIAKLGVRRILKITLSYAKARLFPIRDERSLEDFLVNRFGRELYLTFFKDYTQKVWGVPCDQIKPEWGAQRIKGLSIRRAIVHAIKSAISKDASIGQKSIETSLITQFLYPKFGPGQFWEEVARIIESKGGKLYLRHMVTALKYKGGRIIEAQVENEVTGETQSIKADYFFSSMPVKDLIAGLGELVPADVREVAQGLVYRDFITVGVLLRKLKIKNETKIRTINDIVPDNWIYIQEKDVKAGRLQIFNNWSPYMVKDEDTVWIGPEYFCTEGDELWSRPNNEFIEFAIGELVKIGIIEKEDVLDSVVIRSPKTYPAYFGSYEGFDVIRDYVDKLENLFLVGRNGMHRYNNQDHSMLTAMTAVDNIIAGIKTKDNIWSVNTEYEYHERKLTSVESLIEAYMERISDSDFEYNPDIYWEHTGVSYPHYPTVRHRKRFIINSIKKHAFDKESVFIFDYGCGEGNVLKEIKNRFALRYDQLGGSDISRTGVDIAKKEIKSPYLYNEAFPKLDRKCDIIVCSELIEHTRDYLDVLHWIKNNLAFGGLLVLTTQGGRIHASDRYTGHTQHFDISQLNFILKKLGFRIQRSSLWGFPFFTLQKYLTNFNFERVRRNYLEGNLSTRKRIVFDVAYVLYFIHNLIKAGPQIYIVASNSEEAEQNKN